MNLKLSLSVLSWGERLTMVGINLVLPLVAARKTMRVSSSWKLSSNMLSKNTQRSTRSTDRFCAVLLQNLLAIFVLGIMRIKIVNIFQLTEWEPENRKAKYTWYWYLFLLKLWTDAQSSELWLDWSCTGLKSCVDTWQRKLKNDELPQFPLGDGQGK